MGNECCSCQKPDQFKGDMPVSDLNNDTDKNKGPDAFQTDSQSLGKLTKSAQILTSQINNQGMSTSNHVF